MMDWKFFEQQRQYQQEQQRKSDRYRLAREAQEDKPSPRLRRRR